MSTTTTTTTAARIAIIGAGPAGLLCARVLQGHGIAVRVYDADTAVDSRDAGGTLDLHADTGRIALAEAGLTEAFLALARHEGQTKTRRDHHGTLLNAFVPDAEDSAALEIDRGQLRTMIFDHLQPDTVLWDHKLVSVVPAGDGAHDMTFADGTTAQADLVIGADGAWSVVRSLVTDAVPVYSGVSYIDSRFDDVDHRHPDVAAIVGDGHMFSADGGGRAVILQRSSGGVVRGYVMFRAAVDWYVRAGVDLTDQHAVRRHLLGEFIDWAPGMHPLITDDDGDDVNRPISVLPAPLTWEHTAGVTLLGDAAHVMAPFGGYGVNLALLDGAELARAVHEEATVDAAVARYEATMLPRSGELAVSSNQALARFFSAPFTAEGGPDHRRAHEEYEDAAREYRRLQDAEAAAAARTP